MIAQRRIIQYRGPSGPAQSAEQSTQAACTGCSSQYPEVIDRSGQSRPHAPEASTEGVPSGISPLCLGVCESIAPDIFEVDDSGDMVLLREHVTTSAHADVEAALASCPTLALRLEL
ncbi:ferredoxin [Nocardia higoensis]|uniref:ferredoxin n=1 Tax=Nocardia higoensis TaxID=228599 RepID=UPI002B4B01C0|nr:ferredoxin [Nocardia higoensis]